MIQELNITQLELKQRFVKISNIETPGYDHASKFGVVINRWLDQYNSRVDFYQKGRVESTSDIINGLRDFPGFFKFFEFVKPHIIQAQKYLSIGGDLFEWHHSWANRMHKGSEVINHRHQQQWNDLVCVYYFYAPTNSGMFTVNNLLNHVYYNGIPESEKISVPVKTGDLIVHPANLSHCVSEHCADEPRISFMFDIRTVFRNLPPMLPNVKLPGPDTYPKESHELA